MFESLDVFRMSAALATHAGARQAIIAQNVANADTPDYAARDLPAFTSAYAPGASEGQRATRPGHLHGASAEGGTPAPVEVRGPQTPDGNAVSLETEMLKSVEAKRAHDHALAIYKNALSVLRTVTRT